VKLPARCPVCSAPLTWTRVEVDQGEGEPRPELDYELGECQRCELRMEVPVTVPADASGRISR
jgi:hypothetical protein